MHETSPPPGARRAHRLRWARGGRRVGGALAGLLLAGCAGAPSSLDPRGPRAGQIADLWWLMLGLATAASVVVFALLLFAVLRRRWRGRDRRPPLVGEGPLGGGARMGLVVVGGIAVPVLILVVVQAF